MDLFSVLRSMENKLQDHNLHCHTNLSKQTTLLDGIDVGPSKWRVCGRGLNKSVNEGMNNISNVKVHLKTRSGKVNIRT